MLMRKDVKWQWGQEQQQVFNKLKRIFTTRPVLVSSDLDKEFRVETDASNYAIEGVTLNEVFRQVVKTSSFHFEIIK